MIIDRHLAHQIKEKKRKLTDNPSYYLKRESQIRHALASSLKRHSWMIEHPDVALGLVVKNNRDRGELIRVAKQGIRCLNEAWRFIVTPGMKLSEASVTHLAKLVDPALNDRGYRTERVSMGLQYVPPNALKVPGLVSDALREFHGYQGPVVEAAAHLHLRMAGIQAFPSGNKRVSRLLQDRTLYNNGLPPALIPSGEREVYIDLLEGALLALQDGKLGPRRNFYDYIGGKVNSALDEILGDLGV